MERYAPIDEHWTAIAHQYRAGTAYAYVVSGGIDSDRDSLPSAAPSAFAELEALVRSQARGRSEGHGHRCRALRNALSGGRSRRVRESHRFAWEELNPWSAVDRREASEVKSSYDRPASDESVCPGGRS